MSNPLTLGLCVLPVVVFQAFAIFSSAGALPAKEAPSDSCALLSAAALQNALQNSYGPPTKNIAHKSFTGGTHGMECHYQIADYRTLAPLPRSFFIYMGCADSCPVDAKVTFSHLNATFVPNTLVPGVGDGACPNPANSIYVLKGKVRFYSNVIGPGPDSPEKEKTIKRPRTLGARTIVSKPEDGTN
jgi:hypothetical protein